MEPHRSPSPVFYPEFETMSETAHHQRIREMLKDLVTRHLALVGLLAFVGSDQFIYWVRGNPHIRMSPDFYVALGHDPQISPGSWKTWERGPLDFVLEVVSTVYKKDYEAAPVRCEAMGVRELVIFDPTPGRNRVRWQRFVRKGSELELIDRHDGSRVWSEILQCWLVYAIGPDGDCRVRVATGPNGEHLVPWIEELAESRQAELVAKDAALSAQEEKLTAQEQRLTAQEQRLTAQEEKLTAQEDEIARLRALLEHKSSP